MGLTNSDVQKKIYVNIVGGKLAIKANKETDVAADGTKASKRIATNKQTGEQREVYEFLYSELTATLEDIKVEKNEKLGAYQYLICLDDIGDKYVISIPVESKYGDSLAAKIHNIKNGLKTTIKPYDFTDNKKINPYNGKPMHFIGQTIIQNEEKLANYFSAETPNGRPEPESDKMDEDDYKIYMSRIRKFYKQEVTSWREQQVAAQVAEAHARTFGNNPAVDTSTLTPQEKAFLVKPEVEDTDLKETPFAEIDSFGDDDGQLPF
jgi:outer membrane protein W